MATAWDLFVDDVRFNLVEAIQPHYLTWRDDGYWANDSAAKNWATHVLFGGNSGFGTLVAEQILNAGNASSLAELAAWQKFVQQQNGFGPDLDKEELANLVDAAIEQAKRQNGIRL